VNLIYKQLDGLVEGYKASKVSPVLSLFDLR